MIWFLKIVDLVQENTERVAKISFISSSKIQKKNNIVITNSVNDQIYVNKKELFDKGGKSSFYNSAIQK